MRTTAPNAAIATNNRCREWRMAGQVQGVGFRPCVYRVANELGLNGWVRNDSAGVTIRACGDQQQLDRFVDQLNESLPPLARIDQISERDLGESEPGETAFEIIPSEDLGRAEARVTVDCATCEHCKRELLDRSDRRYRHPLINCTDCGPRYTIIQDTPYDRAQTTMAHFEMCDACAHEYRDPSDRRFHAQPNCCHDCGPRVALHDASGARIEGDPIAKAADALRRGAILAVKGLGGYHLACDATKHDAVAELRDRKRRDHKPFAVMARGLEAARLLAHLSPDAEDALSSPAAPIVLAPARTDSYLASSVSPGVHRVGVMLASTPIHHMLFAEGLGPLVMTSANVSDEPLAKDDDQAARLSDVYDAVLSHNRPIERAVDDSVVLDTRRGVQMLRRARGYVPAPIPLPTPAPRPGLCAGAELKNTIAYVRGHDAILSQHVGDLSHTLACERFARTAEDMGRLFEIEPDWIACDPHPGYVSRREAHRLAQALEVPVVEVQHHHAHLASVLAEHGRTRRAIGLICDGVGYGADGTAWGGEILAGDLVSFERLGRVRPLRLPGGDAAAKKTGRCAAAWLHDRFGSENATSKNTWLERVLPDTRERDAVSKMLEGGFNAPTSSGLGRLFDACAALLGVCPFNHHEAMSGQLLESAARRATQRPSGNGLVALRDTDGLIELDHRPLLDRLLAGLEANEPTDSLAWLFHDAIADGLTRAASRAAEKTGLNTAALSGGVFCNELLTDLVLDRLENSGFECLVHRDVPPNDGGLSYGQAAVAAARLAALEMEEA